MRTFPVSVSNRRRNPSRVVTVPDLFSIAVVFLRGDTANACPATGAAHKLTCGAGGGEVGDAGNGVCRGACAAGAAACPETAEPTVTRAAGALAIAGGGAGTVGGAGGVCDDDDDDDDDCGGGCAGGAVCVCANNCAGAHESAEPKIAPSKTVRNCI